jgi:multidrug efflux pump subunit AcrA (membrane-fusion protein)
MITDTRLSPVTRESYQKAELVARVILSLLYNLRVNYERTLRQWMLVILFIGVFYWAAPTFIGSQASATLEEIPATAKVEKGNLTIPINGMGKIITPSDVFLNAVNGSQIITINVIPGQHVKTGQVLAQLDSNLQRQAYLADQATLSSQVTDVTHALSVINDIEQTNQIDEQINAGTVQAAKVALQNAQALAAANALEINRLQAALDQAILLQSANMNKNLQSLETARRDLMTLEARYGVFVNQSNPSPADFSVIQGILALDQIALNAQTITSPVDGDIGAINGIVGQPAPTKGPDNFFIITNVSKPQLEVIFGLSQRADLVTLGQRVSVNFASLNGGTDLGGKVILNIKSPGLFDTPPGRRLRIAFDEYNPGLYPDLAGKVSLTITAVKQALLVPNGAIRSTNGSNYVVLVEKNTKGIYIKSQQKVIVGVTGLNTTEIRSGLQEGQLVEVANG